MQASENLIHKAHNQLAHNAIRDYYYISNHANIRLGSMTKKLTVEDFVNRARVVHGGRYSYLLVQYVNNRTPVKIICPEHGEFLQSPDNHISGKGCSACAGTKRLDTAEFVRRAIQKHGDRYDYSEVAYTTNGSPVTIICREHGAFRQAPSGHMIGRGCPACGGTKQLTCEQFIAKAQTVHGSAYDYSNVDYLNNRVKVEIKCPEHGAFWQAPSNHLAGKGCPKCAENVPMSTSEFTEKARAVHGDTYDYSLVEYVRSNMKVMIICARHGVFEQTPNNHLSGNGCFDCNQVGVPPMSHAQFIEKATSVHGQKYSYSNARYERGRIPVEVVCPTHGVFNQMPEKHLIGHGCPSCSHTGPSKAQIEVGDFVSRFTPTVLEHPLSDSNYRLDLFLPEHNLAIEYHGLIWHSSRFLSDPRKDYKKHKVAEAAGIRVIHIYEDEWQWRRQSVEKLLLSAIGKLPRIHARKTDVVYVSNYDASNFYEDNHLQGGRQCQVSLGLELDGALVACMSFDILRSSRANLDRRHWELVRYASSATVVGGASKLLKTFAGRDCADRLTSYSDNRVFSGGMYRALGFTLTHETNADYMYTDGRVQFGRKHKSRFQKRYLPELFPGCDLSKTEWEICEENGLYRIYDCGKKRWDLQLNESSQNGHTSS